MQEDRRNKHNEPEWDINFVIPVTRMDNSLAMTMEMATVGKGGELGSVDMPLGGLAIICNVKDQEGGSTRRYAVDLQAIVSKVFDIDEQLKTAEQLPNKKG